MYGHGKKENEKNKKNKETFWKHLWCYGWKIWILNSKPPPSHPITHLELLLTYPNNTEEPDGASGSLVAAESAIFYQGTSLLVSPDG